MILIIHQLKLQIHRLNLILIIYAQMDPLARKKHKYLKLINIVKLNFWMINLRKKKRINKQILLKKKILLNFQIYNSLKILNNKNLKKKVMKKYLNYNLKAKMILKK